MWCMLYDTFTREEGTLAQNPPPQPMETQSQSDDTQEAPSERSLERSLTILPPTPQNINEPNYSSVNGDLDRPASEDSHRDQTRTLLPATSNFLVPVRTDSSTPVTGDETDLHTRVRTLEASLASLERNNTLLLVLLMFLDQAQPGLLNLRAIQTRGDQTAIPQTTSVTAQPPPPAVSNVHSSLTAPRPNGAARLRTDMTDLRDLGSAPRPEIPGSLEIDEDITSDIVPPLRHVGSNPMRHQPEAQHTNQQLTPSLADSGFWTSSDRWEDFNRPGTDTGRPDSDFDGGGSRPTTWDQSTTPEGAGGGAGEDIFKTPDGSKLAEQPSEGTDLDFLNYIEFDLD